MQVLIWGREHSLRQRRSVRWLSRWRQTARLSSPQRDVLSLHLRLNDDTRGIVKLEDLIAHEADRACSSTRHAPNCSSRTRSLPP